MRRMPGLLSATLVTASLLFCSYCFKADLENSGDPEDAENAGNILGLLGLASGNEEEEEGEEETGPPPDNACFFDTNQYDDGCVFGP